MKYFKNTELAKIHKVSEKSVRNWVDRTLQGKLDLQLIDVSNRKVVANTSHNTAVIESLVQQGKKFKNARGSKKLTPKPIFYRLYSTKQIIDIISNITIHGETPLQYTYVNGGAADWDKYAKRLLNERTPNILNQTYEMLDSSESTIERLCFGYKSVNIVDLGPGNGLPIKPTLQKLLAHGKLNKYIPIDISQDMLGILSSNLKRWFKGSITISPLLRDISYERFNDFLAEIPVEDEVPNIVFLLGGTLANFRSPDQVLQVINNSIGINDIFIYGCYLDTPNTRRYFDYYTSDRKVPVQDGLILDLLNIDETLYDVEQKFNEVKRARSISIKPLVDLTIEFKLPNGTRYVELRKGEPVLIWRHWHKNMIDVLNQFDKNGFDIMQAVKSPNSQYALIISKIKTGPEY